MFLHLAYLNTSAVFSFSLVWLAFDPSVEVCVKAKAGLACV